MDEAPLLILSPVTGPAAHSLDDKKIKFRKTFQRGLIGVCITLIIGAFVTIAAFPRELPAEPPLLQSAESAAPPETVSDETEVDGRPVFAGIINRTPYFLELISYSWQDGEWLMLPCGDTPGIEPMSVADRCWQRQVELPGFVRFAFNGTQMHLDISFGGGSSCRIFHPALTCTVISEQASVWYLVAESGK